MVSQFELWATHAPSSVKSVSLFASYIGQGAPRFFVAMSPDRQPNAAQRSSLGELRYYGANATSLNHRRMP
jgi:hypothetical protein